MPIRKLCIIAYRKEETEVLEARSLRRIMQLYSCMMYGAPIKIDPDDASAQSKNWKGTMYQCQMCNLTSKRVINIEKHMDTHVLVLIKPE
jgi:hypothetical protein